MALNNGMAFCSVFLCLYLNDGYTLASKMTASPIVLNHLAIDTNTNDLYIGAVNYIFKLSDMEVVDKTVTGPVNNTDNVNKVLVIDTVENSVIICGTNGGACSARDINNISHVLYESREAVVPNSAIASAVAFIAPGPAARMMYVGVTSTTKSDYEDILPAVSSRSLEDQKWFTIPYSGEAIGSKMYVNSLSRNRYPINYVYGFSSEGFSYFLTTQLKEVGSDKYQSKLVRICHGDENYYSYTEVPITCGGRGLLNYNLVQAAFVGKAGSSLAGKLGVSTEDDVLYAAFSPSLFKNTSAAFDASALCVYTLKDIRRKFTQNIKNCFQGNGSHGLDFITPIAQCIPAKYYPIEEDFCGVDVNTPLGGEIPVEASPVIVFAERLTAVVAKIVGDKTVIFAGTSQGHLKNIEVLDMKSANENVDLVLKEGSSINDLVFDSQKRYLYVMSETQIHKVKVADCDGGSSSNFCMEPLYGYCVWCTMKNECNVSDC